MNTQTCSCIICRKLITSKGIHSHFIRTHTEQSLWKQSTIKVSCICCKKELNITGLAAHLKKCLYTPVFQCPNCKKWCKGKNKKFCSQSCSTTLTSKGRRHTASTINKIRQSVISNPKGVYLAILNGTHIHGRKSTKNKDGSWNAEITFPYTKLYKCNDCNKLYPNRGKYCITCRPKHIGGYREKSGRAKSGYYKGIYCGSTYELIWCIHQIDHNLKFIRFPHMLEYENVRYYPDFYQNNKIVEIKGFEASALVEKKTHVANMNGYDVIVLRKEDLTNEFSWVKENYTYKNIEELYDDNKPMFKYICNCCKTEFSSYKKRKTDIVFCSKTCAGTYRSQNRPKSSIELNKTTLRVSSSVLP